MRISGFSELLVNTDWLSNNIPFFSTITSAIDIFEKWAILPLLKKEKISKSYYFTYLNEKNTRECLALLIPFLRTVILHKFFNNKIEKLLEQAGRYRRGDGVEQDLKRAWHIYHFIIEKGYKNKDLADAVFELACRYEIEGKEKSDQEKLEQTGKLYQQAADLGNVLAMYNLAVCYENGSYGIEKSLEEALKFLQKRLYTVYLFAMKEAMV